MIATLVGPDARTNLQQLARIWSCFLLSISVDGVNVARTIFRVQAPPHAIFYTAMAILIPVLAELLPCIQRGRSPHRDSPRRFMPNILHSTFLQPRHTHAHTRKKTGVGGERKREG